MRLYIAGVFLPEVDQVFVLCGVDPVWVAGPNTDKELSPTHWRTTCVIRLSRCETLDPIAPESKGLGHKRISDLHEAGRTLTNDRHESKRSLVSDVA